MADDPPILTSKNARNMFETYLQDYLERMNLHHTSRTFILESDVDFCPEILREYDGPKGHLYEWWSIFYDKYRAKYQRVQIPQQNQLVEAANEKTGGSSTSTDIDLETDETKSSVPTMAGDPPTLASDNHRPIFETYLHNYLEKMNLRRTAATLVLETDVKFCPEILGEYDGPRGHLYEWWLIFYDQYSARDQHVQIPHQNQQMQGEGGSTITAIDDLAKATSIQRPK